jgi:hypothetical protein
MPDNSWRSRVLGLPALAKNGWQNDAYMDYRRRVLESSYPCFFGQRAEQMEEIFYAFIPRKDRDSLLLAINAFVEALTTEQFARFSLIAFFETDELSTHSAFSASFWSALQLLADADYAPGEALRPTDDPLWEFSFRGIEMFVVGLSESYRLRRSRQIGAGMALIFQPRILFTDPGTGTPISLQVRQAIHRRMQAYDGYTVHPDIGVYGSPDNREWKQYVLPDDNSPTLTSCPFHVRQA